MLWFLSKVCPIMFLELPAFRIYVSWHGYLTVCIGSGAGLSIEDANVLGLAVRDYLANPEVGLSAYTSLYQETRLPRAQKAQVTSRQAAEVYDMQGPDFEGLNFEECLPVVKEKVSNRMAWVWNSNLEADYAAAKARKNLP